MTTPLCFFIVLCLFFQTSFCAELPSVEQIMAARETIRNCHEKFYQAQERRVRIEKKICLRQKQKDKRSLDLQVFDFYVTEINQFLIDDYKVMNASSDEKMRDLAVAFSSNCSRFVGGLSMFTNFALGKRVPKDFIRQFKNERKNILEKRTKAKSL